MKTTDKIVTKYKGSKNIEKFFDPILNADEDDLKVLLAAIFLEEKNGDKGDKIEIKELCDALGVELESIVPSIKYWKGAGVIGSSRKNTAKSEAETKQREEKNKSAHRDGKVEREEMPMYTTEQLTALMEKRKITSKFIDEASRVYGKIFNQHEVEIVVRIIDYLGFDEECVLMLLSHYAKEKKTLRYIEKTALSFYDEGISDATALGHKLRTLEQSQELEGKIRVLFGMNGRALTAKEKKFVASWAEKGFDIDLIRLAYDKTVDTTNKVSAAYANTILEDWYAKGIDTPQKVQKADEEHAIAKGGEVKKSYDSDDFFEAALKRSYENG